MCGQAVVRSEEPQGRSAGLAQCLLARFSPHIRPKMFAPKHGEHWSYGIWVHSCFFIHQPLRVTLEMVEASTGNAPNILVGLSSQGFVGRKSGALHTSAGFGI